MEKLIEIMSKTNSEFLDEKEYNTFYSISDLTKFYLFYGRNFKAQMEKKEINLNLSLIFYKDHFIISDEFKISEHDENKNENSLSNQSDGLSDIQNNNPEKEDFKEILPFDNDFNSLNNFLDEIDGLSQNNYFVPEDINKSNFNNKKKQYLNDRMWFSNKISGINDISYIQPKLDFYDEQRTYISSLLNKKRGIAKT